MYKALGYDPAHFAQETNFYGYFETVEEFQDAMRAKYHDGNPMEVDLSFENENTSKVRARFYRNGEKFTNYVYLEQIETGLLW